MNIFFGVLFLILSYLVGSIPWGFIFGKLHGIDLRTVGSKNIGATNTGRILGKKYAIFVYILDMLKGFIFVFLYRYKIIPAEWCILNPMLYGLFAVLGHTFPIYIGFKGGKSVSCGSGAIAGYFPYFLPVAIGIFFLIKAITKLVSLSSLICSLLALLFTLILSLIKGEMLEALFSVPEGPVWPINLWFVLFSLVIVLIVYVKHASNIKRIFNHTEQPINY